MPAILSLVASQQTTLMRPPAVETPPAWPGVNPGQAVSVLLQTAACCLPPDRFSCTIIGIGPFLERREMKSVRLCAWQAQGARG